MSEFHANLWAPWRMQYIRSLAEDTRDDVCFLCRYAADPASDRAHHVLWRTPACLVVMNRFPYTNGHLMIAPRRHVGEFEELDDPTLCDLIRSTRDAVRVLRAVVRAQGFNVGFNLGVCAGAGLPGHVHAHVVPRWAGDTNYMAVLGQVRVIPDALDALYEELRTEAHRQGYVPDK
ncbi:MAG: HIT domain-containing protein [Phycisphaerae bacterium]|nr:HIT domain-containing protein [Phycisphaerae bacterium]